MRSISVAIRKRPVEPERVERLVNSIVRQLESMGETEIASSVVGELVMKALKSSMTWPTFATPRSIGTSVTPMTSPAS